MHPGMSQDLHNACHITKVPSGNTKPGALILDLDNTLTDTRAWFADFILPATAIVASELKSDAGLVNLIYADIAKATTLHEYAFAIECIACRLASHRHLSQKRISEVAHLFWQAFSAAHPNIRVYRGVIETLRTIRAAFPLFQIIIMTDSPEWVALERLHLTGILPYVDGVVAIRSDEPKLRYKGYRHNIADSRARIETLMSMVPTKHLRIKMAIPSAYAKPSSAGIELISSRLGPSCKQLIIVGDKDGKEGIAAHNFRVNSHRSGMSHKTIDFVRAAYGNHDLHHERYQTLGEHIPSLQSSAGNGGRNISVTASLDSFMELPTVLEQALQKPQSFFLAA